jgi:DNA mismatch endonuclease (patch repair protein)
MADVVDKQTRSRMMQGIRGKNTKPEVAVRKGLHALGFRFRLHDASLPGRPDIVIKKHRVAVLVHGCFWHGHEGCRYFKLPSTNPSFWKEKIFSNRQRDARQISDLMASGWRVAVVWECRVRTDIDGVLRELAAFTRSQDDRLDTGVAADRASS